MKQGNRLALIAIGNSLRTDDGIALALCRAFKEQNSLPAEVYELGLQTQMLAGCLSRHERVVILDAILCDKQNAAGVLVLDLNEFLASTQSRVKIRSCHGISLIDELKLLAGANAHALPEKLFFYGIEVLKLDWGEGLSPEMEAKLPELTKGLDCFIREKM